MNGAPFPACIHSKSIKQPACFASNTKAPQYLLSTQSNSWNLFLFDSPFIKTQLRKQLMRFICNEMSQRIHLGGEHSKPPNAILHIFISHQNGVSYWEIYSNLNYCNNVASCEF
jgi:hypothetical protein